MHGRARKAGIGMVMIALALVWLAAAPTGGARGPYDQETGASEVYAEAVGQANLRGGPGVDYALVGEIVAGTRYRVLARHEAVPWLRLDYPPADPAEAWVFAELVTVTGDLALLPLISDLPPVDANTPTANAPAIATPTPTLAGPVATTLGEANIRYGPGIEFPQIIEAPVGASYRVLAFHSIYPWVLIAVPESPNGKGWIYSDIVEIAGDTSLIPVMSGLEFSIPELTPTPQTIVVNGAPGSSATLPSGSLASTLGVAMHTYLIDQGYVPYSDRFASVFVLDLQSGDTFSINDDVAYSGMSLTKIPILVTYFLHHQGPLSWDDAFLIADTMMCSENITTNQLLGLIGSGDPLRGAQRVTVLLQSLDLTTSFIMRQYAVQEGEVLPEAGTITTRADQVSAQPDMYNQIVPQDIGWLLAGIYQCARNETGLLVDRYPGEFTAQECRLMLQAMDANEINVFLEAGVPDGTQVIHKHGWIGDTHGDAGIVIGPDRAYVFVAILYGEGWLEFDYSAPVIAELSRMTWNAFNPDTPLDATRPGTVPDTCDPRANPVLDVLLSGDAPAPGP
ncbi:MAG: serine hydrolase [Anaerolineae bacterium]|nr:serine hydrolase [Anaerolineae bacterium]